MKFSDQSIQLVKVDQHTFEFMITRRGQSFLQQIDKPISIVTIAGLYRTGKSYLINKLLKLNEGFQTGSSTNSVTKGLNVWGRPILAQTQTGQQFYYILIDSEGLGSLEQQNQYDLKLLLLIFLISSTVVYNSVGAIDEVALDQLRVILNLKKCISNISTSNPRFVWVLRDFALQLVNKHGNEITSNQYMESCLEQVVSTNAEVNRKNQIRKAIKQNLPDRSCYTLVRPTIRQDDLCDLNSNNCKIRSQFLGQIEDMKSKLFGGSDKHIKRINEREVDGKSILKALEEYVKILNSGELPNVNSVWQSVLNMRSQQVLDDCFDQMAKQVKKVTLPLAKQELKHKLNEIQNKFYNKFSNFLKIDSSTKKLHRDFIKYAQKINKDIKEHNTFLINKQKKSQLIKIVQQKIKYDKIKPNNIFSLKPILEVLTQTAMNHQEGYQYIFQVIYDILHIVEQKAITIQKEFIEVKKILDENSNEQKNKDLLCIKTKHHYHEALKQISQLKAKIMQIEKQNSLLIENRQNDKNLIRQMAIQQENKSKQHNMLIQNIKKNWSGKVDELNSQIKKLREDNYELQSKLEQSMSIKMNKDSYDRKQFIFQEKMNQIWSKFDKERLILMSNLERTAKQLQNAKNANQKLQEQLKSERIQYEKQKQQSTNRQKQFEKQLIDLKGSIKQTKKSYELTYQTMKNNDKIFKNIENLTSAKKNNNSGAEFQQQKNLLKNYYQNQIQIEKQNCLQQISIMQQKHNKLIQQWKDKDKKNQIIIQQLRDQCHQLKQDVIDANKRFLQTVKQVQTAKEKERNLYQQSIVRLLSNIQRRDSLYSTQSHY